MTTESIMDDILRLKIQVRIESKMHDELHKILDNIPKEIPLYETLMNQFKCLCVRSIDLHHHILLLESKLPPPLPTYPSYA